jgi:hypothetical protein
MQHNIHFRYINEIQLYISTSFWYSQYIYNVVQYTSTECGIYLINHQVEKGRGQKYKLYNKMLSKYFVNRCMHILYLIRNMIVIVEWWWMRNIYNEIKSLQWACNKK